MKNKLNLWKIFPRFIYWNSHFYGSNFYGWSIGDLKSLTKSGPFHAQGIPALVLFSVEEKEGGDINISGRGGVANQPWLGSWNDNVTVTLITCQQFRAGKISTTR